MLYDDLIMAAAGAGERKFPGLDRQERVICWHGPGLASP